MTEPAGKDQAVVAVYPSHELAEQAILELKKAGYDLTKLSIIGRDCRKEEHVVGFYNMGDRVAAGGKRVQRQQSVGNTVPSERVSLELVRRS